MQPVFEFAPVGAALTPVPSKIALDVGSRLVAGVVDHHCRGVEYDCAASLVVSRPELVTRHLGPAPAAVTYVVHREPDLDCVAAAYFAHALVRDGKLPASAREIADYVRVTDAGGAPPDGIGPGSIWAMYYAAVELLDQSPARYRGDHERFCAWMNRGFELLDLVAAGGGKLPAAQDGWDAERALLADDQIRYEQDLSRARRVTIELPRRDGGVEAVAGLVIENPQALLFKHMARAQGFTFLHVHYREPGSQSVRHVLSVAPESKVFLLGLGALLEREEDLERQRLHCFRTGEPRWPDVSSSDPWYDGRSPLHAFTIVDSPRGGTVLRPDHVERLVAASSEWIALGRTRRVRVCPFGCRYTDDESAAYCPHHGAALLPLIVDGKYEIVRPLGQGGMGSVFEVKDLATGLRYALKVISRHGLGEGKTWERFAREAQMLASVSHPLLMQYHGFGSDQSTGLYLLSELVAGIDLEEEIEWWRQQGRPMDTARAAGIGSQIARALEAIHCRGVVHRDLKPQNIRLPGHEFPGQNGELAVKLLDFGIAVRVGTGDTRLTTHGVGMMTPVYAAPEQLAGEEVNESADMYALGAIVFELLTSVTPFAEHEELAPLVCAKIMRAPEPVGSLRPELAGSDLEGLVKAMLARDPRARPGASAVAALLHQVASSGNG